jgi:hypothetical protein
MVALLEPPAVFEPVGATSIAAPPPGGGSAQLVRDGWDGRQAVLGDLPVHASRAARPGLTGRRPETGAGRPVRPMHRARRRIAGPWAASHRRPRARADRRDVRGSWSLNGCARARTDHRSSFHADFSPVCNRPTAVPGSP